MNSLDTTKSSLETFLSIFPKEMLTEHDCPHCAKSIGALKPGANQLFVSLIGCPHCTKTFYRHIRSDGSVKTILPELYLNSLDFEVEKDECFVDAFYEDAARFVYDNRKVSIASMQRHLRTGYNRSARMIETLEAAGLVTHARENGMREVVYPKTHVIDFRNPAHGVADFVLR